MINTQEKVNLLDKLTNLTKEGKIKSFLKNNLIIDITNINKIKFKEDDNIKISNKCIHLFKEYSFEELKPTCTDLRRDGFKVKINNGKVFVFCKECYEKIKKETKK